jgi:hypothetical protein
VNPTYFHWAKGYGVACHDGVEVKISTTLETEDEGVEQVHFIPGVVAMRVINGAHVHMDEAAQMSLIKRLFQMSSDARDAIEGKSTLVVVCE